MAETVTMTITEGLAELKTIDKRIQKKREFVLAFLYRQDALRDPHEKDGGSAEALKRERQAIGDLQERKILIREEIASANAGTMLTVRGKTRPISEWLVWRRDVAPAQQQMLNELRARLQTIREQAASKGFVTVASGEAATKPQDVIVNLNEAGLAVEIEELENVLGTLDGALSLKNATVMISVRQ